MSKGAPAARNWRHTFEVVGFRPSGQFGAMRARVEDVDATVLEDGLGRLSMTFTHVGRRSAMQYEVAVPFDVTVQQVARLMASAFERAHPETREKTATPDLSAVDHNFVRVGGVVVEREQAFAWAHEYLTGSSWAYPGYDAYYARSDPQRIEDADLLAPVLLNVSRLTLKAYYGLQKHRERLQDCLAAIPEDAELISAGDHDLETIRKLFAVLNAPGIPDVQGTILAKILHRKRPAFIPLYDERVRRCYQVGPRAPLPVRRRRPWGEFFVTLAMAMRSDLVDQRDTWTEIANLATSPRISLLRALDIVAWRAGGVDSAPHR
ncbi:hypothetical protein EV137_4723 [Kribbella pratensis]|uniref:Uncharacterized protein n=1 Tax=Kribbella pratensis TaxID=2512112 RepID=A0ABY2FHN5_9ACTN|nr:DUF6308 family protein [Kribbella pratensis]TDW90892.1 hypothetical protein EV137_4723 [Kribbella pratensis]